MKKLLPTLLIIFIGIAGFADEPAKGFKMTSVNIGYMSQEELGRRVEVNELADYIKRLEAAYTEFFASATAPDSLEIVVAVKPDQKSRVWISSSAATIPSEQRDKLRAKLESVPTAKVSQHAIAFAVLGQVAGGDPKAPKESQQPPIPMDWKLALSNSKEQPKGFDDMLAQVWPGSQIAIAASEAPAGFVNQELEPTGGHMLRPKDWFYKEDHHGQVFSWIISREDISKGGNYETGVRIDTYVGVQKNEGKDAKQFIADFVASKKKGVKLIKVCLPESQGMFMRQCLELERGPKHILYSLFWGNDNLDIAVVMTAESTKEMWADISPTFDKMNSFELINMARFQKSDDDGGGKSDGKFKVPAGVTYKQAAPELNEEVKKLLLAKFNPKTSNNDVLTVFQERVICGPGLWAELKDDEDLSKLPKGHVNLQVDSETLEGKLFQSSDEILVFWRAFNKKIDLTNFKIRKLNEQELKTFWAIISFDIEEPVYILESDKRKILVFCGGKSKIFWIDDLENIHLKGK